MEDGQGVGLASVMNKDGWGRRSVVGSASFDRSLNLDSRSIMYSYEMSYNADSVNSKE